MYIPDNLLEPNYPPNDQALEIDKYRKHQAQIWKYERWAKRANEQIPGLAMMIFGLRNKNYTGWGFHYAIERRLGKLIATLNEYDDCPPTELYVGTKEITQRILLSGLFEDVVNALKSIGRKPHGRTYINIDKNKQ